ncbi:MAG: DUF2442 domain-containing protein [Spirochaetes bacterium]|nr:DUF2442 domain-containing protein [Spirochaetota bacterium]
MSSTILERVIQIEPVAVQVLVDADRMIHITLHDDRVISFPAHKFTRLRSASLAQLTKVRIRTQGTALRWDELDEDLPVRGIVYGIFEED